MTLTRRQRSALLVSLSAAVAGSILFASTKIQQQPFLRNNNNAAGDQSHRQLTSVNLARFVDPKSVAVRSDAPRAAQAVTADGIPREQFTPVDHNSRKNCQIIYIMGVEGATHHGFIPIIEALAKKSSRSGHWHQVSRRYRARRSQSRSLRMVLRS